MGPRRNAIVLLREGQKEGPCDHRDMRGTDVEERQPPPETGRGEGQMVPEVGEQPCLLCSATMAVAICCSHRVAGTKRVINRYSLRE